MALPHIENVVTTVDLGCLLNLGDIAARSVKNVEYNPKIFNGLTMRIHEPKSCANIFSSGKMVCLGNKDEESAKVATAKFAEIIKKLGYPVKFLNYRITNILASCDLNFRPDFEDFYYQCLKNVDYSPELFPGLVYRNGVTIVVFKSGKVIITKAETREKIYSAYEDFLKKVRPNPKSINRGGLPSQSLANHG